MNGEKSGESGRMVQPLLIEWLQSSRWDQAIFLMIPGTSCLATIVLSLRDKNHPPIEAPRIILALTGRLPKGQVGTSTSQFFENGSSRGRYPGAGLRRCAQ
jgi:hypothetical protein